MPPAAIAIGGGALLGGLAGGLKDKSSTSYTSGMNLDPASWQELMGQSGMMDAYKQLQGMVGAGPGQSDVEGATGASRGLADMLKAYSEGGFLPGQGDINTSNDIASRLFQGQRTALSQNFSDQLTDANRQAALMGRDPNDPILKAKLAQEQTRQASLLDANQGSFAQQFALSLPGQRLDYANQRVGVMSGLASQAMANRQAIAAMGEGIMNNERNFRMQTAQKYGTQATESGGGLKGALTGFLGGAGTGASIASGFGGLGGFGGGAAGATGGGFAQAQQFFAGANPYGAQAPGIGGAFQPAGRVMSLGNPAATGLMQQRAGFPSLGVGSF